MMLKVMGRSRHVMALATSTVLPVSCYLDGAVFILDAGSPTSRLRTDPLCPGSGAACPDCPIEHYFSHHGR